MSSFDMFFQKLLEDGFSKEELEFLAITETNIDDEDIQRYIKFPKEYHKFIEKLTDFLNEYNSDCAMY